MDKNSLIIDIAVKYGVEEALVFDNILYWIKYNVDKEKNFYEGDYWTYGSYELLVKRMPYLKNKFKVSRIIDNLISAKLIKRGCFNKIKYDRTSWYALDEVGKKYYAVEFLSNIDDVNLQLSSSKNATCKVQKCYIDDTKSATPIPTREQQEKQQENKQKESKKESSEPELVEDNPFVDTPFVEVEIEEEPKKKSKKIQETETYNQVIDRLVENKELNEILKEWVKSRLFRKEKFTNKAIELNVKRLMKMPEEKRVVSVEDSIINGWKGIFEHKEKADSSAWLEEKRKENELKAKELDLKEKNQPYYQKQIEMQSGKVEEKQQGKESQDKSMALFTQYYDDYIKGNISKEKLQELGMDESLFFQLDSDKANYQDKIEMQRLKAEYEKKWGKKE